MSFRDSFCYFVKCSATLVYGHNRLRKYLIKVIKFYNIIPPPLTLNLLRIPNQFISQTPHSYLHSFKFLSNSIEIFFVDCYRCFVGCTWLIHCLSSLFAHFVHLVWWEWLSILRLRNSICVKFSIVHTLFKCINHRQRIRSIGRLLRDWKCTFLPNNINHAI